MSCSHAQRRGSYDAFYCRSCQIFSEATFQLNPATQAVVYMIQRPASTPHEPTAVRKRSIQELCYVVYSLADRSCSNLAAPKSPVILPSALCSSSEMISCSRLVSLGRAILGNFPYCYESLRCATARNGNCRSRQSSWLPSPATERFDCSCPESHVAQCLGGCSKDIIHNTLSRTKYTRQPSTYVQSMSSFHATPNDQ